MKIIKAITAFFSMLFCGMAGGQGRIGGKAPRRFGLPAISLGFGFSMGWNWRYLAFLGFVPVLIMGYGVDSQLGSLCGHVEWLIRLVYATLLSLPFFIFGIWRGVYAVILLVVAFQVHAGSLGHVSFFGDLLIEDIVRYGTLGGLVVFNVVIKGE